MDDNKLEFSIIRDRIEKTIDFYRSLVLDSVEQELGTTQNWKFVRSRLLKIFGDRGLTRKVLEILDESKFGIESQDRTEHEKF